LKLSIFMEMASGLLSRNNLGCFAFYFSENRISFDAVFFLQKKIRWPIQQSNK